MPPSRSSGPVLPSWVAFAIPLLVAAWLRLHALGDPGPFVDEGANILSSFHAGVRAAFEPLEQGRPLVRQLFFLSHVFPAHALMVARLTVVLAGLITLTTLGWILHRFSGRVAALCGMWMWAVLPLAVFHERLALQDPASAAFLVLALACVMTARPGAAWNGLAGGWFALAFLNKISAVFALPWIGLIYLAWQKQNGRRVFDRRLAWIAAGAAAVVLLYLRGELAQIGSHLGRYHGLAASRGSTAPGFVARLGEWIGWYRAYGGWPLGLLLGGAVGLQCWRPSRAAWLAGVAWLATLAVNTVFYGNLYARYLCPDAVPLVLFLSLSVGNAWSGLTLFQRRAVGLGVVVALGGWLNVARQIAADPASAPLPAEEKAQYLTGPWSGRGVNEVSRFLQDYADRNQVSCVVLTPRFYSPGCYGLMLVALGDPRVVVVPLAVRQPPDLTAASAGLSKLAAGQRTAFFLLYEGSLYPAPAWLSPAEHGVRRVFAVPHDADRPDELYQFDP